MHTTVLDPPAVGPDRPAVSGSLSGWGRFPCVPGSEDVSERLDQSSRSVPLTRGLGRAYGDAALPAPGDLRVACSARADRILAFDPETGRLRAEAGLSLDELYRLFLPRGCFTPVTPGTALRHARRHGRGRRARQEPPRRRLLRRARARAHAARRRRQRSSTARPTRERDLFLATIGGMGLTGHILDVEFAPRAGAVARGSTGDRARSRHRRVHRRAEDGRAALADDRRAGSTASRAAQRSAAASCIAGRWAEPHEAPEPFPRAARADAVPFDAARLARCIAATVQRVQRALLLASHRPQHGAASSHPDIVLLPARRRRALEPALRPARLHAVSVRAARATPGRRRRGASSSC